MSVYPVDVIARFWEQVDRESGSSGCWLWRGSLSGRYGNFRASGFRMTAHRFSYLVAWGLQSCPSVVKQTCGNSLCCNPAHLTLSHKAIRAARLSDEERFWSSVDKSGECWLWTGQRDHRGYGRFWTKESGTTGAHRFSMRLVVGEIPCDIEVCHRCDANYPLGDTTWCACVNPDHLFLGTHKENFEDAVAKGRMAAGERHGSRTHPERVARGDRHVSRKNPSVYRRGEDNPTSKLTNAIVLDVLERYASGEFQADIGRDLRISSGQVNDIVQRKIWKHVKGPTIEMSARPRVRSGQDYWKHRSRDAIRYGEQAAHVKLTRMQVDDIVAKYAVGALQRELAQEYGVCQSHVSRIIRGESRSKG